VYQYQLNTIYKQNNDMFGSKPKMQEGVCVFSSQPNGQYRDFIFGVVTGVDGTQIGVNGLIVNPVGLKNKVAQGKAGSRSVEILENPTSENCIFALVYRIEHENYTAVLDLDKDRIEMISKKSYYIFDGWVKESLPELLNNVLSLQAGDERDKAKRVLKNRMDTLLDKDLKRNLYSVCRSLKILTSADS